MDALGIGGFPPKEHLTRAKWAPVMIQPVLGSPERFLIGVAVVSSSGFHVESANRFDRLRCLYDADPASTVLAATTALEDLRDELAERGTAALLEYRPLFSGVTLGPLSEGEGQSLIHIAATWMSAMSSLYQAEADKELALISPTDMPTITGGDHVQVERLPQLILRALQDEHPILIKAFSSEIRQSVKRSKNATGVSIDFAGEKLVANFGTLHAGSYAASVGRIKHRMWDLKVDRDKDRRGLLNPRTHEMIVQYPPPDDPQITEKQSSRIADALGDLEKQADQEELRFRPMTTVGQIAQHLVQREAAN